MLEKRIITIPSLVAAPFKCLFLSAIDLACYNEANNVDNCASGAIIGRPSQNVAKIAPYFRSAANQNKMEIARLI